MRLVVFFVFMYLNFSLEILFAASRCLSKILDKYITLLSLYLTTDPLMKQFLTESMCGYFSGSVTETSVSLMLRYWSTECRVPQMERSFFSSTTTSFPTRDLKNE